MLTKILKPDQFTSEHIGALMWEAIAGSAPLPADVEKNMVVLAGYILEQLGKRGIILADRISKPERFNSLTMAILAWEQAGGPDAFGRGTIEAQRITIDQAQYVLDALKAEGVLG